MKVEFLPLFFWVAPDQNWSAGELSSQCPIFTDLFLNWLTLHDLWSKALIVVDVQIARVIWEKGRKTHRSK